MRKLILATYMLIIWNGVFATNSVDSNYTLPFRIEHFAARVVTSNEININFTIAETFSTVTHYEILRSYNSIDFEVVGSVTKTSNNPTSQPYTFVDNSIGSNGRTVVYYRLRQVTNGQGETYSHILVVKMAFTKNDISVWPMPFANHVNFNFATEHDNEEVLLIISEISGRQVYLQKLMCMKGSKTYSIEGLGKFPKGSYILTIKTNTKTIGTKIINKN